MCAVAAALADADFFFPIRHRGASHSLGSAALAAVLTFLWLKFVSPSRDAERNSLIIGIAYATHVLFDWLGADSSSPRGLMAMWPFTSDYYISDLDIFNSVDRRYWLEGFWQRNIIAVTREVGILTPVVALAWWMTHRGRR